MNMRSWKAVWPWVTAFAIAMAFLESAVVIYLRQLYYPTGFRFPIAPIDARIALTEVLREIATILMLLAPGALLARTRIERFAWFCFCFGIWDIFYYVFLKAILGWPTSLVDWDILFLVPVVWVGPVLAPCIVSLGLITLGLLILRAWQLDISFRIARWQWALLVLSGTIILYTFIEEPVGFVLQQHKGASLLSWISSGGDALGQFRDHLPERYAWWTFAIACALGCVPIGRIARRDRQ